MVVAFSSRLWMLVVVCGGILCDLRKGESYYVRRSAARDS